MRHSQADLLLRLFDENTALYQKLRAVAGDLHKNAPHREQAAAAGRRAVLHSLDSAGPQTVPQLARARQVSRQHMQVIVNGLAREKLVVREENPAHRKSLLVRLTAEGQHQLENVLKREKKLLERARPGLAPKELNRAAETLAKLRHFFESKEWGRLIARKE